MTMSEQSKKQRAMSPKGFLAKTSTRAANSAGAFLASYREYLTTGELAPLVSPILARLDAGQILPTPALTEVKYAVMTHIINTDVAKMEKVSTQSAAKGKTTKAWRATVYNAEGVVQTRETPDGPEELIKGYDLAQEADRWADRRLFEGAEGWYALVEHTTLSNVVSRIERNDSIARILKQPKGPSIQQKGKSTKTLGFGVKCKESRCSFSRG
jgi:hypothetical protein